MSARYSPSVWVTVESAGTHARFHRVGGERPRWFVESLRFGGSELLSQEAAMVDANPVLVEHLEALYAELLGDK